MNLFRRGLAILILVATVASALASPLRVNIDYGVSGSHGSYVCYLYRNGTFYAAKPVTNKGTVTGYVEFDVPRGSAYAAMIHCTTDNRRVYSSSAYYYWYLLRLNLSVQFS